MRMANDDIIVKHSAFAQIVPQGCQYKYKYFISCFKYTDDLTCRTKYVYINAV